MRPIRARHGRAGFTLAEAAVTIAIVALVITWTLQGLQGSKTASAHVRYRKTAYELGMNMLGEISAGLWLEEIESGMTGTFADDEEPDYRWEVALGDDVFQDVDDEERPFDNFAARRDWQDRQDDDDRDTDEDEEAEEPFEKVKLRVLYPQLSDFPNDLVLELWVPWDQVYGKDEEDDTLAGGPLGQNNGGDGDAGGSGSGQGSDG